MDIFDIETQRETQEVALKLINESSQTQQFQINPRPYLSKLCAIYSIQGRHQELYELLKSVFFLTQSDTKLQYRLMIAAISCQHYKQAYFFSKNLLVTLPKIQTFQIAIKLCINHLELVQYAATYAQLGLKRYESHPFLIYSLGVSYSLMGDQTIYHKQRVILYQKSLSYFQQIIGFTDPKFLLHLGLTQAKLGLLSQAIKSAAKGYQQHPSELYSAFLSLLLISTQQFISAFDILRSGIQSYPGSKLLRAIKYFLCRLIGRLAYSQISGDRSGLQTQAMNLVKFGCQNSDSISNGTHQYESGLDVIREVDSGISESNHLNAKNQPLQIQSIAHNICKLAIRVLALLEDFQQVSLLLMRLKNPQLQQMLFESQEKNVGQLICLIESPQVCEVLSQRLFQNGEIGKANVVAHHAILLDENSAVAWKILGRIYEQEENYQESMKCYIKYQDCLSTNFKIIPILIQYEKFLIKIDSLERKS